MASRRDGRPDRGQRMYLWRAVDHEGEILDVLVQRRRDRGAAVRLMRKLMRKQGFAPKRVVTDKLRSYGAAFQHLGLSCHHEQGLRQNNRAENSHQVVRRRERKMQRFKSPGPPRDSSVCMPLSTIHSTFSGILFSLNSPDLPIRCSFAMAQRDRHRMKPTPLHPISAETTAQLDNAKMLRLLQMPAGRRSHSTTLRGC